MSKKPKAASQSEVTIELIEISKLIIDPKNVRLHGEANMSAIKESLQAFGQQKPILIQDDNTIIAGNGTVAAATELGWQKVSAIRTSLKGEEAMAYAIADNRTAELAEWDMDALAQQLGFLKGCEGDLVKASGWIEPERFLETPAEEHEDEEEADYETTSAAPENQSLVVKQVVMIFEKSIYDRVVESMDAKMEAMNTDSHATVLANLLGVGDSNEN